MEYASVNVISLISAYSRPAKTPEFAGELPIVRAVYRFLPISRLSNKIPRKCSNYIKGDIYIILLGHKLNRIVSTLRSKINPNTVVPC